jgi:hypothetical protein
VVRRAGVDSRSSVRRDGSDRRARPAGDMMTRTSVFAAAVIGLMFLACTTSQPERAGVSVRDRSECGPVEPDEIGSVDVAIVIDSSRSTVDPSGSDIDQDGRVGRPKLVRERTGNRQTFLVDSTDPDDSGYAAQIVAARSLIRHVSDTDARFSIVSFSGKGGDSKSRNGNCASNPGAPCATVVSPLTDDAAALVASRDRIANDEPAGTTEFAAGMEYALDSLAAPEDPSRNPRKRVLFMSDSSSSISPGQNIPSERSDPAVKGMALAASNAGIVVNSFGLGDVATMKSPHPLSMLATETGGTYYPVRDEAELHCELLRSLVD